jgi:hypothetical protein
MFSEKYIKQLMSDSNEMINGNKLIDKDILARAIDIMGTSAFLDNRELSPVISSSPHQKNQLYADFPQNCVPNFPDIYTLPYSVYKEPAKRVIDNLELCFQRNKVFRRKDHNMLSIEEQRKFAPQVKKSTITIKEKVKEMAPLGILKIYRALKNK